MKEDFNRFWDSTVTECYEQPLNYVFEDYPYALDSVCVKRVYFDGFRCGRIDGLYIAPKKAREKLPVMLFSHGYSTRIFCVSQYLRWIMAGYAVFALNVRGQGEPKTGNSPGNRVVSGIMTRGIEDKENYIYRYIYADFQRALRLIRSLPELDSDRIGIFGASQGGGIAIATAALDKHIKFITVLYPFMSDIASAFTKCSGGPYEEIWRYFKLFDPEMKTRDKLFDTLSYFDNISFAPLINCPVLMGICMKDTICPPESTQNVFDTMNSEKELHKYYAHGHEDVWEFEDSALQYAVLRKE